MNSAAIPSPDPTPEEVARGLADIERHLADVAPPPHLAPVVPDQEPEAEGEGETKRVKAMRARVAEAHRLVELQDDETPLLVDTAKVGKRRRKVAEAARLYELSQDPAALAWSDARVRRITSVMAMSAAVIALGVSSIGVQASVAKGLALVDGSIGWWAAYGVEPILSLPLLAAVVVQAYAAMRGRRVDRSSPEGKRLLRAEALLLGLTLVLNCWPALQWRGFDLLPLIVHALGPLGAVTAIWLLPTLWSVLAALPVPARTGGSIRENALAAMLGEYSRYTPDRIEALTVRVREMIAAGELPADPGVQKIRAALGVGTDTASKVKRAMGGGA
ncbi:hypothetical protein DI270_013400 [Microbispora triticiradicis]|uniref:Conjugal transfer protein TraI n=1 Tax=Microbispora triticiradicis TaxID=2200763 RepID=A0ABX9LLL1_9ACTN|nr:hypothetical protein [Microbispora triticiradicis]RGA04483.1 hypothetical protein DI270_013400 [Microbispora triticiradicis]